MYVDLVNGLTIEKVREIRRDSGLNQLEKKKGKGWWGLLVSQFKSPLIYILFGAGIISLLLRELTDAVVIFMAVGVNSGLGFWQEFKAEKALEALKSLIVPHATVIRNGKRRVIETKYIVPGDLVVLKMGDRIPADGIVIEAADLYVDEAILTGESEAINKRAVAKKRLGVVIKRKVTKLTGWKERNVVYMGTTIAGGKGLLMVVHTGMETRMGSLAGQLEQIENEETPLRQRVGQMAKFLTIAVGIICLLIFVEGLVVGRDIREMLEISVAVAVASIPEGLVVSVTVILTLGMQRILKQKGLVRKLLAAETLGSVDMICVDKTGTLTEGKMRMVRSDLKEEIGVLGDLVCCNPMINSVDTALANWGKEKIALGEKLDCGQIKLREMPFSSINKFTAVMCRKTKNLGAFYVYGAPEKIMGMCRFSDGLGKKWQKKLDDYTKRGFRVIGIAREEGEIKKLNKKFSWLKKTSRKGWQVDKRKMNFEWMGMMCLADPVRKEVKGALRLATLAGIEIKVITGDYQNTALKVLEKVKIGGKVTADKVMSGEEMRIMDDKELVEKIDDIVLFYRTTPEQKIRIVKALQEKGHVVAMMGDGVNDSLALKKSDIGVVVNEASEVAKETADMVLMDSNFSTIITAIREGRKIFENIRKVVLYLISGSFSEVILVIGALLMGLPIPFLAVQILWINIIEDSLPALALAFEKDGAGVMKQRPRPKEMPIINRRMYMMMGVIIVVTDVILFVVYDFLIEAGVGIELTRTIIFAILGIDSLLFVFSCKSLDKNIWEIEVFSNKYLNWSVVVGTILLVAGIYLPVLQVLLGTVPINAGVWVWVLILGALDLAIIEILKLMLKIRLERKNRII